MENRRILLYNLQSRPHTTAWPTSQWWWWHSKCEKWVDERVELRYISENAVSVYSSLPRRTNRCIQAQWMCEKGRVWDGDRYIDSKSQKELLPAKGCIDHNDVLDGKELAPLPLTPFCYFIHQAIARSNNNVSPWNFIYSMSISGKSNTNISILPLLLVLLLVVMLFVAFQWHRIEDPFDEIQNTKIIRLNSFLSLALVMAWMVFMCLYVTVYNAPRADLLRKSQK